MTQWLDLIDARDDSAEEAMGFNCGTYPRSWQRRQVFVVKRQTWTRRCSAVCHHSCTARDSQAFGRSTPLGLRVAATKDQYMVQNSCERSQHIIEQHVYLRISQVQCFLNEEVNIADWRILHEEMQTGWVIARQY